MSFLSRRPWLARLAVATAAASLIGAAALPAHALAPEPDAPRPASSTADGIRPALGPPPAIDKIRNLIRPPLPDHDLAALFASALEHRGVPHRHFGSTPDGFDDAGLVRYVFAEFGIELPHSAALQSAQGRRISLEHALPGDLVFLPGKRDRLEADRIGFYAGKGEILHVPVGGQVAIVPFSGGGFSVIRIY